VLPETLAYDQYWKPACWPGGAYQTNRNARCDGSKRGLNVLALCRQLFFGAGDLTEDRFEFLLLSQERLGNHDIDCWSQCNLPVVDW
jgi:hypothetical protein